MQLLTLSTVLPKREYTTDELTGSFPCELPEGVRQNVANLGVSKRHLLNDPFSPPQPDTVLSEDELVNLCSEACNEVIEKADLSFRDIGCLIAAYDVSPFLSPGLGQLIIPKLGLNPYVRYVNVQGIASTAFPKALEIARDYVFAHGEDYVLICVSGVSSYWFQNQVRGISNVSEISKINLMKDEAKRRMELRKWIAAMQFFLFGDGVAAAIMAKDGKGLEVKKIVEVTNVGQRDYLAGYARLEASSEPFSFGLYSYLDKEIPKLGVEYTGLALKELFGKNAESKIKAVRKWAVHTGSEKILNLLAERHGIKHEKMKESHELLKECGNLAGASLPFIIERIISCNGLSANDIILMMGYGWGFSAAAGLLEFKSSR